MSLDAIGLELGITGEAVRLVMVKVGRKLKESGQADHIIEAIMGGLSG